MTQLAGTTRATVGELARRIGMRRAAVSVVLRGIVDARGSTLRKIARGANVSVDALLDVIEANAKPVRSVRVVNTGDSRAAKEGPAAEDASAGTPEG